MNGSTALNAALLLAGVALLAAPVAFPADAPPDRVEYYVEGDWSDYESQPNLDYGNLSADEKHAFDAARTNGSGRYDASLATAPEGLTPPPNGIDVYNVRYEGAHYLLQVKHLTYEADFETQVLPRLGALAAGAALGTLAAYRQFV